MKRPEQALHIQVAKFLAVALRPPTFWTSIEHATKLGPVAASMRKARGVKAGLPDLIVMHPTGNDTTRVVGIELKAKGGMVSASQKAMFADFLGVNARYAVCRTIKDVEDWLFANNIPLHAKLS